MTLLLALAATLTQQKDPFQRYDEFAKAHPAMQVHLTATVHRGDANGPTEPAVGMLRFVRPDLLLYRIRSESFDYSVSDTPKGYVEIENQSKVYDEFEDPGGLAIYDSEIAEVATMLAPRFLMMNHLKTVQVGGTAARPIREAGIFRGKAQVTSSGSSDEVYEKDTGSGGIAEMWVTIDAEGKIASVRRKITGPRGSIELNWQFTDYNFAPNTKLDSFVTPLPAGYVPHTVPRLNIPLQIGRPAPLDGWTLPNGRSGNLLEAAGNKPFLIVYSAPGSVPGTESMKSVDRLKGKLPIFVIANGGIKDPDGSRLKALNPPGSPMFYLVGKDGKVSKLWFGFDPTKASAFESDVLNAASGKS